MSDQSLDEILTGAKDAEQEQKNSVLERIRKSLEELTEESGGIMQGVYYGRCTEKEMKKWNMFVFRRTKTTKNNSAKVDFQTFYEVAVIRENYIPEGYVQKVIDKLQTQDEEGTKLKATADDIQYAYSFKGNTSVVLEAAFIQFVHPEKRC